MERVTADMIAEKEFSIESKGYNKNEVDNFLDEICEEMDRLNNEIFDLRQKTTMVRPQAPAESAPSGSDESRFREILEMAAQVKEETIRRAKEDAEAIRVKAETEATERLEGLAAERDLPIQSHLSENQSEMAWVRQLHPDCEQYWETYAKYGLWNDKTLMAHCVWSDARERKAIKDAGVWAVHCASSNENLVSGYAPVRVMLNEGLNVVLGSDIAGGDHLSMFKNITAAIRASKARRIMDDWKTDFLTVEEAFYLGTSAAASFFGEKPGFAPGNTLHAIVVEDETLPMVRPLSVHERFERCVYRREHGAILAVYSEGRKIFGK